MIAKYKMYPPVKGSNQFPPSLYSVETEITKMIYIIVRSDSGIPVFYESVIHFCNVLIWSFTEVYYVSVTKMSIRREKYLCWIFSVYAITKPCSLLYISKFSVVHWFSTIDTCLT